MFILGENNNSSKKTETIILSDWSQNSIQANLLYLSMSYIPYNQYYFGGLERQIILLAERSYEDVASVKIFASFCKLTYAKSLPSQIPLTLQTPQLVQITTALSLFSRF